MYHADKSELGVFDPICLELAKWHNVAVDAPKTGKQVPALEFLKIPEYPDHACATSLSRTYPSKKILGKLFRRADAQPTLLRSFSRNSGAAARVDPHLVVEGFEQFLEEAVKARDAYSAELKNLMLQARHAKTCPKKKTKKPKNKNAGCHVLSLADGWLGWTLMFGSKGTLWPQKRNSCQKARKKKEKKKKEKKVKHKKKKAERAQKKNKRKKKKTAKHQREKNRSTKSEKQKSETEQIVSLAPPVLTVWCSLRCVMNFRHSVVMHSGRTRPNVVSGKASATASKKF